MTHGYIIHKFSWECSLQLALWLFLLEYSTYSELLIPPSFFFSPFFNSVCPCKSAKLVRWSPQTSPHSFKIEHWWSYCWSGSYSGFHSLHYFYSCYITMTSTDELKWLSIHIFVTLIILCAAVTIIGDLPFHLWQPTCPSLVLMYFILI